MEVARRRLYEDSEENALKKWYPIPTSGSLELYFRCCGYGIENWTESPDPLSPLQFSESTLTYQLIPVIELEYRAVFLSYGDFAEDLKCSALNPQGQITPSTSIARHIEYLEATLRLTRSQLAQALRVERATLYQWLRGAQPRARTGERLEQLRQFSLEWNHAGLGSARTAWYFRTADSEHTLGSLLMQDPLDLEQLRAYIRHAQQSPQTMKLVETGPVHGFPAEDQLEERRRKGEFFPPTFSDGE